MAEAAPRHPLDPTRHVPTVLIVEDEFMIRVLLADYLQECGFKILAADDAAQAVSIIENSGVRIDLVLSDLNMSSEMNGFGLRSWLNENKPGLPIILCSGDAKKADTAKRLCEEEAIMQKPYDLKMVVARVRAILSQIIL